MRSMASDTVPRPHKCLIKNIDTGVILTAQFNPKELQLDKEVPWTEHKGRIDNPNLEYTCASAAGLSVELLFDTYESRTNVNDAGVALLRSFAEVADDDRRPPMCLFLWGKHVSFMGVIVSLQMKYTMFLPDGTPVRATCTIRLKEADAFGTRDTIREVFSLEKERSAVASSRMAADGDRRRADRFARNHRAVLDANDSDDGALVPGRPVASCGP